MSQHSRPLRHIGAICLTTYLLCGAAAPEGCKTQQTNIGPTKGQVIASVIGAAAVITVATVVLVEVHKSHHTVKGCVSVGPNGMEVTTAGDKPKTYLLEGDTAAVKVGDLVQFHGNKVKRTKDGTSDQTFKVQTLKKDYGACRLPMTPAPAP